MAFCVQREREREGTERGKRKERKKIYTNGAEREGLEVFKVSSLWGPICWSKMPYHMTCLTFGPHSAKAVRLFFTREHKASQPQRPPFTPPMQLYSKGNR